MPTCNNTLTEEKIVETPLWKELTFHHFGLILSAVFGLISVVVAFFLIFKHATHYLKPWEQKHIIRILLMIPIYSVVSFLSYLYYRHAIYFEVLRDCYEAFAISAFFTLLCHYIAPNLHEQKDYFRTLDPIKNWFWGVFGLQRIFGNENKGILRKPRSGLTWFNVIWFGVFQYCFIRVLFTIVSVVSQVFDRYCESSLNPAFAHVWVMCFEGASVTVAMFCLIQFYLQLKEDLAEHKPFFKVLCIKLVIFFSFWQTILISFLTSAGVLKASDKIDSPDIKIGIPSMLLCIEMAIFAVMHLFAFPWKEYDLSRNADPLTASGTGYSGQAKYRGGPLGIKALLDAFNPWDIIKASARGTRWVVIGRKHRFTDASYSGKVGGGVQPSPNGYAGPTYAGNGEAATELDGGRRGRADTFGPEEDTAGLLGHAQLHGLSPSPDRRGNYRSRAEEQGDLSMQHPVPTPRPGHSGGLDVEDPGYHMSPHIPPSPGGSDTGYHAPPQALSQTANPEWDHWAGANRDDADSMRPPPSYRTTEER